MRYLINILTLMGVMFLLGCSSSEDKKQDDKQYSEYRYYDIVQDNRTNDLLLASLHGLRTATIQEGSITPSQLASINQHNGTIVSKSLAYNSLGNLLAIGTIEGVTLCRLQGGTIISCRDYEDGYFDEPNHNITAVMFVGNNLVATLHGDGLVMGEFDAYGTLKNNNFTHYNSDKDSTLDLQFTKDIKLYKNKLLIASKKFMIADYNATSHTLSNFNSVSSATLGFSTVSQIAINEAEGLIVLATNRNLIVGTISDNGSFEIKQTYAKGSLPFTQYQSVVFNNLGDKIAVGEMGKRYFSADINQAGVISNIVVGEPLVTQSKRNNGIRTLLFSNDDQNLIVASDSEALTIVKLSE